MGIAAFAGVATGGALIARDERRRQAYTPEEIRALLHSRAAEEGLVPDDAGHQVPEFDPGT